MDRETAHEIKCDRFIQCMRMIDEQLDETSKSVDMESVKKIIEYIVDSNRIFIMGAGRSGLVGKGFAMRLMHMGFDVYVIGETTTPAVKSDDLVIAISGSGETTSITNLGKVSKNEIGAKLIAVTSNPDSTLGKMADVKLTVGGRATSQEEDYLERHMRGDYKSMAPMGTMFELLSIIVLDAIIAELIAITGASEEDLRSRHATLE